MYIAIIADNIANRKHLERLLDRTSDAIKEEIGNLYIESYGNPEAMWPSIKRYDLFFVEITQDDEMKLDVIYRFMELNMQNQVVICQPEDSAFANWSAPQGFLTLSPPPNTEVLTKLAKDAYHAAQQKSLKKRMVEVRDENETHYLEADRIVYAIETEQCVKVHLTDGTQIEVLGNILAFHRATELYEEFTMYGEEVVVNKNYMQYMKGRTITLVNNETITLSLFGKMHLS